jgi:hypothetical protein
MYFIVKVGGTAFAQIPFPWKRYSNLGLFYILSLQYAFFRCLSAVFRDNKLLAGVERLADHPPLVGAVVRPIPEAISQLYSWTKEL